MAGLTSACQREPSSRLIRVASIFASVFFVSLGILADVRALRLSVLLFVLLTYALPFEGKDTGSTLLKILNEPAPPLANALVARALAASSASTAT